MQLPGVAAAAMRGEALVDFFVATPLFEEIEDKSVSKLGCDIADVGSDLAIGPTI